MYRLVYLTLLNFIREAALQGVVGMLCVGLVTHEAGVVILIAKIFRDCTFNTVGARTELVNK